MAVALAVAGLLLMGFSAWSRHMSRQVGTRPSVQGVIVESDLRRDSNGSSARVAYEYVVLTVRHRSTPVGYAGMLDAGTERFKRVERYPVGRVVPVFYDPTRPNRAVLERATSPAWRVPLAVGALLILSAAVEAALGASTTPA